MFLNKNSKLSELMSLNKFFYFFIFVYLIFVFHVICKNNIQLYSDIHINLKYISNKAQFSSNKKEKNNQISMISHFHKSIKTAWEDYFPSTIPDYTNENAVYESNGYIGTSISGDYYFYNCIFRDFTIQILNMNYGLKIFLENCIVTDSINPIDNGVMYLRGSDIILNKVCGYNLECTNYGIFYSLLDDDSKGKHIYKETSLAFCRMSYHGINMAQGSILVNSLNCSHNYAEQVTGCIIQASQVNENFEGSHASFSSFAHNNATDSIVVEYTTDGENILDYSNVIYNLQAENGNFAILSAFGTNVTLKNDCIMKNTGYIFFTTENQIPSAYFTLIDCSLDGTSISTQGSPLISNDIGTNSFINGLQLLETGDCVSIYETVENVPISYYGSPPPENPPSSQPEIPSRSQSIEPEIPSRTQNIQPGKPSRTQQINFYFKNNQEIDQIMRN